MESKFTGVFTAGTSHISFDTNLPVSATANCGWSPRSSAEIKRIKDLNQLQLLHWEKQHTHLNNINKTFSVNKISDYGIYLLFYVIEPNNEALDWRPPKGVPAKKTKEFLKEVKSYDREFSVAEVVYVGASKKPIQRISDHLRDKKFTHARVIKGEPHQLPKWEKYLINKYQPKYNIAHKQRRRIDTRMVKKEKWMIL